jgi:hypothetical protein
MAGRRRLRLPTRPDPIVHKVSEKDGLYCVARMIGSEQAAPPGESGAPAAPAAPAATERGWLKDNSIPYLIVGAFVLALISVLVIDWVPSSDPWAWIDWGQEITSSHISLSLAGGPSWKPFPVVFTTIFGLFGHAAPDMWLVVTRTAGLLAIAGMFRLGRRFGGVLAGIVAVIALCFVQDALFYFARGASEPVVAALTVWAIDRHLAGSRRLTYVLIFLATMNRPEFSAFLGLYAIYLWFRVPGSRPLAVIGLVLVPIAWLGGPYVISGNAFQAGNAALGGTGSPGGAIPELRSASGLMSVPTLVLAAIGLAFAWVRRETVLLWLAGGAVLWALMVAIMTQVAYGLPRYLLPAGMVACVLAGVGVARIAEWVGERLGGPRIGGAGGDGGAGGEAGVRLSYIGAAVVVCALTLPWSITRVDNIALQGGQANQAAYYQHRLFTAVDRIGGRLAVVPCKTSQVTVNHSLASVLAWKLQVPERRVHPSMRATGYVFSAPRNHNTGTTPPIAHNRAVRTVLSLPPWTVLLVRYHGVTGPIRCPAGARTPAA